MKLKGDFFPASFDFKGRLEGNLLLTDLYCLSTPPIPIPEKRKGGGGGGAGGGGAGTLTHREALISNFGLNRGHVFEGALIQGFTVPITV